MTNNKQQTAVERFGIEIGKLFAQYHARKINIIEFHLKRFELEEQAKEMEIAGKEMSYSDGYAQGYQRALDYISMSIENAKALISSEII